MESVNDVKEALSARSRTATLDQLASEGRKRVRLIRAEHVAAMITEAVHSAVQHSGHVSQEEVDLLVEKSRQEFRSILREREAEAARGQEVEEQLAEAQQRVNQLEREAAASGHGEPAAEELAAARERVTGLEQELADLGQQHQELQERLDSEAGRSSDLRQQLASVTADLDGLREEHEAGSAALAGEREAHAATAAELAELRAAHTATTAKLAELERLQAAPATAAAPPGMSPEVMAMMLNEIANLKASMLQKQAAPQPDTGGLSDALEKIAGSLNDRLDQFGRKMGLSSAVAAEDVDFAAMFAKADETQIESNMDNIQVKQTTGGGIGANLARLKKLKGGG